MARTKKTRTPIPENTAAEVLFRADRTCCVCRERGKRVQIHHIDERPSNHDQENLAALCYECHEDTQIRGGFSRKLDAAQVCKFRDEWYERVVVRRDKADELAALSMARPVASLAVAEPRRSPIPVLSVPVEQYVSMLPQLLRRANAQAAFESARSTAEMMNASYQLVDVVGSMLGQLCSYYPPDHFDGQEPKDYISEVVASRWRWHRHHLEVGGEGTGGTIVGPSAAGHVIGDLEDLVVDMAGSLMYGCSVEETFDWAGWLSEWRAAAGQDSTPRNSGQTIEGVDMPPTCPNCSRSLKPIFLSPIPPDFRSLEGASHECTRCGYKLAERT